MLKKKYKNIEIGIGIFSPTLFMVSVSNTKFRSELYKEFNHEAGMLFPAKHFSNVSSDWGVGFTLWRSKKQNGSIKLDVKDINSTTRRIEKIGEKEIYSVDRTVNAWAQNKILTKNKQKVQVVPLSDAFRIRIDGESKLIEGFLGGFHSGGNSINDNATRVTLSSSGSADAGYYSVVPENFKKVVAFFTARKTIVSNWVNCKDEYLYPNTSHPDYEQWNNDAIVYSLFNGSSQQSSLRQVEYKDEKHNIYNEFFFMSLEEMRESGNKHFRDLAYDARDDKDRYVYNILQDTNLSPDAQEVLDAARDLVRISMKHREVFSKQKPKYHLQAWDAGWAQLKPLLKKEYADQYNNFVELYKKFEDRLREGVYKFGFLRR